jgi:hypothetical protein
MVIALQPCIVWSLHAWKNGTPIRMNEVVGDDAMQIIKTADSRPTVTVKNMSVLLLLLRDIIS